MKYTYEIRRINKNTLEEEWVVWTTGSLDDCMEDFFYHKAQPIYGQTGSRITWEWLEE